MAKPRSAGAVGLDNKRQPERCIQRVMRWPTFEAKYFLEVPKHNEILNNINHKANFLAFSVCIQ